MAKVSFNKLDLKKNQDVKIVEYNEQKIEVKQYLPVEEKLELISKVLVDSADQNNFVNPIKLSVFLTIEIIDYYTNINLTEKQKEDATKTFDLIAGNGFGRLIINAIPEDEVLVLTENVEKIAEALYNYKNSVYGILDSITTDYDSLNMDAEAIKEKIADPENLTLLKDVMTRLG